MSKRKHKQKNKHDDKHKSDFDEYEFTAFSASSLLSQGDNGHSIGCGDTFKMPSHADVCITVSDDDKFLSGDSHCDENANDHKGQAASIQASGAEAGNGGQIYAEVYHWVYDQHGNWYVMVEIEQEGSHEDYFTFYTGQGYSVPPEGAHLTVHSASNVTSDWIKFDDLGAGDKVEEATGTISGTVFHDTDCDGVNGELTIVPGHSYTIEAEHMHEKGFHKAHGSQASGGEFIKLNCAGGSGKVWTDFMGKTGTYDLKIRVQDENDGQSVIKLLIGGHYVDAVRLDRDSDGGGSDHDGFSTYVIEDVNIKHGQEIELVVYGDHGEFVRIDKIDIEGEDTSIYEPEPVKAGVTINLLDLDGNVVETTVTDAHGNYAFENVPVGDYRIEGVAPDGTKFTIQDAGHDDSRDSDVDGTGTSDVITVTRDSETDVDLGLCEVKEGAISGTVFHDTNCDGINGELTLVPGHAYTIEAEHMHEWGFHTAHGGQASGGQFVKLDSSGGDGQLWTYFNGKDGSYDLKIRVQDENDGRSVIKLFVGGHYVDAVRLDRDSDGGGSDHGGFSTYVIEDVHIDHGEKIKLAVYGDHGEYVRIDKIELTGEDTAIYNPEPVKAGVTINLLNAAGDVVDSTVTDADGNYRFDKVPVGDYRIEGVAPDGRKFAPQDQGHDDSIDSDVNSAGQSDLITVTDESETDVDLGLCEIKVTDDAGKGCADELITVDLSDNYTAGAATITALDGVAILDGETKVISGVTVTRDGDEFIFDGEEAYAALDIGEMATQSFTFTVAEGGGTATANIDVMFCGDANSYESLAATFPTNGTYQVENGLSGGNFVAEGFAIRVDGTGDARFDGQVFENAYCLSFLDPAAAAETFGTAPVNLGDLFSAEGAAATGVFNPSQTSAANGLPAAENLDLVSYIVAQNHEGTGTYTGWEVQFAIWELTDQVEADAFDAVLGTAMSGVNVDAIVEDALMFGEGFTFGSNGQVGAIIDPNPSLPTNSQPFIIGFDFDAYDCLC